MNPTTIGAGHVDTVIRSELYWRTKDANRVACVVEGPQTVFELEHMGLPFLTY